MLAVDGWAVTFGIARRGLGGDAARPGPSSLKERQPPLGPLRQPLPFLPLSLLPFPPSLYFPFPSSPLPSLTLPSRSPPFTAAMRSPKSSCEVWGSAGSSQAGFGAECPGRKSIFRYILRPKIVSGGNDFVFFCAEQ